MSKLAQYHNCPTGHMGCVRNAAKADRFAKRRLAKILRKAGKKACLAD